ncbi:hypothetical protein ACVBEJ_11270 [Porticoccus sp. GXU_MW_L64]
MTKRIALPVIATIISTPIAADVSFSVDLESLYTDNAQRIGAGNVSERQDRLSLSTDISHQNSWLNANINYRATQLLFDKDSQEDRLELDGQADFLFGSETGRFNVSLNNSKRQVLSNPSQTAIADNLQTRDVTTIEPRLNIFQDQADTFSVVGTYSIVNFDRNESAQTSFDTTTTGASLSWARRISKVDTLTLTAQHQDIEYDDLIGQDYQLQSALLSYSTQLRQLSYTIAAGYNVSKPDIGEDDSSPRWEISVQYDSGANVFSFLSEAAQTDPSRGNQNQLLLGSTDQLSLGNGITTIAGTFDRKSHTLTWTNSSLCKRCTVTLTGGLSSEDYSEQSTLNSDNDQLLASIRWGYQLTRASNLSASFTYRDTDFDSATAPLSGFDSNSIQIAYNRQIAENFSLRLNATQTDRSGEVTPGDFDETSVSVAVSYQF